MSIATFRIKYPRPKKLSDPYHDFTPDMLEEILAIPDDKLKGYHFLQILGPTLPAGTYEESVYFLPGAFRYLITDDEYAPTLINPIVEFISKNAERLAKDKILDAARECIHEAFDYWTNQFVVVHRRAPSINKVKRLGYSDYAKNFGAVWIMIVELLKYGTDDDIAEDFVQSLSDNTSNPIKAAWYLTCASYSRDLYRQHRTRRELNSNRILQLIQDKERLKKAAELVREKLVPGEKSPTFWRDVFNNLGV
ncbi:MAG: hypothetical protein ABI690_09870 [Chloroflexota bacterium]